MREQPPKKRPVAAGRRVRSTDPGFANTPRNGRNTPLKASGAPEPVRHSAPEPVRLSKWMADQGLCSRREADAWIEAGQVRVDGQVAVLGQKVLPHQKVEIAAAARAAQQRLATILLHKPIGYVSGQAEEGYQPARVLITPANHWSEDPVRRTLRGADLQSLVPAGRLDIESTGLLVLTQDGRLARQLIGEDSTVDKEYLVRVQPLGSESLSASGLARLRHGLQLDGRDLKPAEVDWINDDQLRFVLREGRKRQIRRMCEAVGLKVLGLKRVRIGRLRLGRLPLGQWRWLAPDEQI